MDTIPCPGCCTPLNLSDTGCPICLRGRSKHEILRGYAQLREDKSRRRRRPFIVLGALLAVGGVGRAVYLQRARITHAYDRVHARVTRFTTEAGDPAHYATYAPATPRAPVAQETPRPIGPPPAPRPAPAPEQPKTPSPASPKNVSDLVVPPMDPGMWAVYGRVYDLKTLKPAGNAAIEFVHSDGGRSGGTSDENGRYLVTLPRSSSPGGYEAVCRDARYQEPVFHEADIPYAKLPSAERENLIDSARSGDTHATPLVDITGEDSRRLDLFLAPRR